MATSLLILKLFFFVFIFMPNVQTELCVTPNDERAACISLYNCPLLVNALLTQNDTVIDFVRQSHCGEWNYKNGDPKVCCGTASTFTTKIKKVPLSEKRYCGYQHSDDYFKGERKNETAIEEFPWLAVFMYQFDSNMGNASLKNNSGKFFVQYGCAGTLINARYVLTAAQCLKLKGSSAIGVRLGEYNLRKETDCVTFSDIVYCSNPVEDVGLEEKIIHPMYDSESGFNDIALVRLKKTVEFTDYIRPICLPIPGTILAQPEDTLTTTGFGRVSHNGDYSVIKKKTLTKLITNEECAQIYSRLPNRTPNITQNVLCAEDFSNNTVYSCEGDTGAPAMVARRTQWHIEGFIVWGYNNCGTEYPRMYTKVINFLDWIRDNLRPWQENPDNFL